MERGGNDRRCAFAGKIAARITAASVKRSGCEKEASDIDDSSSSVVWHHLQAIGHVRAELKSIPAGDSENHAWVFPERP